MKAYCRTCRMVTEHCAGRTLIEHCDRCDTWNGVAHGRSVERRKPAEDGQSRWFAAHPECDRRKR
jgi:hypothetical protein